MTTAPHTSVADPVGPAPLVTVAICTHKRAHVLPRAVKSVLAQTYTNLELIVVNDCSPDNTVEVLAQFDDPRLTVVTNEVNKGLPASRNVALSRAAGAYVAFVDDDDEFAPTKIEKQVAAFARASDRVGAIWCFQEWRTPAGTNHRRIVLRGDVFDRVRATDIMMMQPLLIRREVFETTGLFDPELNYFEDFDWTFRLAKHFELETVEEDLVIMHDTPGSMSKNATERVRVAYHVLEKYPELHNDPPSKSRWLIRIAESHAAAEDRPAWRRVMLDAWKAHPTGARAPFYLVVGTLFGPSGPTAVKRRVNRLRRRLRNRQLQRSGAAARTQEGPLTTHTTTRKKQKPLKAVVSWARPRLLPKLNGALRRGGTELVRAGHAPTWRSFTDLVDQLGITPRTVFDIGVAKGSPFLYDAFPAARYHLIDPSRESLPHMLKVAGRVDATIHEVALADQESTATLHLKADGDIGASTLILEESFPVGESYEVPCERLDTLVPSFERPALCKIDIQGAELSALKGMTGILDQIDVLVVESSTMPDSTDAPECADVIAWLAEHGFALFDIVDYHRRPLNGTLGQIDLAFVPADAPVRADRRWS